MSPTRSQSSAQRWQTSAHTPQVRLVQVGIAEHEVRAGLAGKIADLRNVLGIIALCAAMGTTLTVEARGEDEQEATQAIEQAFALPHSEEAWKTGSSPKV